ncbi:rhomboid family intramembrane serine protease [Fulvivirga sp. 29W222]|uniref:Rhomboid family intramembrane serine protease n=1 Tax=Fulvivirga marina TaxID=2494733 RepID=A0A937G2A1_9BACT|nr:rhomboid family intramembrane serine protease [Fulvivirga marina]MBL6449173.1 rhomboid family intramembrane serine protease [Fulvivirga marina]
MTRSVSLFKKYPWITYLLLVINISVFGAMIFLGYSTLNIYDLLDWGANFYPYTFKDEWWRLITSMFLHIGFLHLLVNMFTLYSLGSHIESKFGHRVFIVSYLVSGLSAGLVSGYYNLYEVSAGASGAIFGIYGFYIVQVLAHDWEDKSAVIKSFLGFALYIAVFTVIGTQANFDNEAHFGGLGAGIVIGLGDVIFNTQRTHRIYPLILVVSLALIYLAYQNIPRSKVQYFDMFQVFMETDNMTVDKMNARYASDSVMANNLGELLLEWDTVRQEIDALPVIPAALESDRQILENYTEWKKEEISFILTILREESYIYMDSLDFVRAKMDSSPPLQYVLNYNRPLKTVPDSAKIQDSPVREVVEVYYDSLWNECPIWKHHYYRRGYKDSLGRWDGYVRDYYKNGKIQMKGKYSQNLRDGVFIYYNKNDTYSAAGRYKKEYKVGKWQYFYETGTLSSEIRYQDRAYTINTWDSLGNPMVVQGNGEDTHKYTNGIVASYENYVEGRIEGEAYGYHRNGKPYYKEFYRDGRLVYGRAVSLKGERFDYDMSTFIPHAEGGADAFLDYIDSHKIYPAEARKNNISGDLEVVFTVHIDGTISDVRFLNHLGYGCEEEAERLLKEGPEWIPAYLHGMEPVTSEGMVNISFP